MDADGSHAPEQLPRLLAALEHADLVLGSRWVEGGQVVNWPRSRELLSRGGNAYARLLLRLPLRDATGGYRAYRREVLDALPLAEVASQGYCFQVDLAWRTWQAGYRVVEVPITFVERERGESKMSRAIVLEALWRVTWWGLPAPHAAALRSRGLTCAACSSSPWWSCRWSRSTCSSRSARSSARCRRSRCWWSCRCSAPGCCAARARAPGRRSAARSARAGCRPRRSPTARW